MPDAHPPTAPRWRKSSFSENSDANCVEVGFDRGAVLVRDTKQRGCGPVLSFTRAEWAAFLAGARAGEFDRP